MTLPLFLIPIIAGLTAQGLKKALHKADMPTSPYGGMPSTHSAFAFSLLTLVASYAGITSLLFAITVTAVIYIVDDALRMRVFIQRYGQTLQKLTKDSQIQTRLGHTWPEVLAGAGLGIIITLLITTLFT